MDMTKTFQIKLDGGTGNESFYLDNIYYWSFDTAYAAANNMTGISDVNVSGNAKTVDIYGVDGSLVKRAATSLSGLQKGLYIVNGKKIVVK